MSVSLPSIPIYSADVPEVQELSVDFQYNFFVADESINELGSLNSSVQKIVGLESNQEFVKSQTTKLPRVNLIQFKLPSLVYDNENVVHEQNGSLITSNLENVITEQEFANGHYVALTFSDSEIDDKLFFIASGSVDMRSTLEANKSSTTSEKINSSFSKSDNISKTTVRQVLNVKSKLNGTRYFDSAGKRIFNSYYKSLKNVNSNMQLSSRLVDDICNNVVNLPMSINSKDFAFAKKESNKIPQSLKNTNSIIESDYQTFLKYISVSNIANNSKSKYIGKIVGFIVDKAEISQDGGYIQHDPIVIDDPRVSFTADFKIKYNSTYVYSVRTVALFDIPAVDDESGDIGICKILISSKPSSNQYVQTIETTSPPPPSNINFVWDYERVNPLTAEFDNETSTTNLSTGIPGSLMINWTFPTNSQRDIKKFQVFRRSNIHHPFELIKMYNFDNSAIKIADLENPDETVLEFVSSPYNYFFDDEFQKTSKYIYAICCIDAHGMTSGYSEQFEVWFDEYLNKVQKRIISHSGAPKPYPNLFLEKDIFKDTIRTSGEKSKRLKIYFSPEAYETYDANGMKKNILVTNPAGEYTMNMINLDNQKSTSVNIKLVDNSKKRLSTTKNRVIFERSKPNK
jgi:hypothetical protein